MKKIYGLLKEKNDLKSFFLETIVILGIILFTIFIVFFIKEIFLQKQYSYLLFLCFYMGICIRILILERSIEDIVKIFSFTFIILMICGFRIKGLSEKNLDYINTIFLFHFIIISFIFLMKYSKKISFSISYINILVFLLGFIYLLLSYKDSSFYYLIGIFLVIILQLPICLKLKEITIKNIYFFLSIIINIGFSYLYLSEISDLIKVPPKFELNFIILTFFFGLNIIYTIESLYKIFLIIPKKGMNYTKELLPCAREYYLQNYSSELPKKYDLVSILFLITSFYIINNYYLNYNYGVIILINLIIIDLYYKLKHKKTSA